MSRGDCDTCAPPYDDCCILIHVPRGNTPVKSFVVCLPLLISYRNSSTNGKRHADSLAHGVGLRVAQHVEDEHEERRRVTDDSAACHTEVNHIEHQDAQQSTGRQSVKVQHHQECSTLMTTRKRRQARQRNVNGVIRLHDSGRS